MNYPIITSAMTSNRGCIITFIPPSGTVINYEYSLDNSSTFTLCNPPTIKSPIKISGLVNGKTYDISLRAVNSNGTGLNSKPIRVTIYYSIRNTTIKTYRTYLVLLHLIILLLIIYYLL